MLALATALVATGCTPSKPSVTRTPTPTAAPAPAGPQTFSVSVDATAPSLPLAADEYFPSELSVHPGDTIQFNEVWSGEPHTVTLGTLVDQAVSATASPSPPPSPSPSPSGTPAATGLPTIFPRGRGDAVASAAQPCFLDTGAPPANTACPKVDQPAFSGGQSFYSSGWLPPTSTFTVAISPTISPGTYNFRCLVHPNMTGRIDVVAPSRSIPNPAEVAATGASQVAAVVAALTPVATDAAAVTTTQVAGITAGDGTTNTLVATFGPPEIDVSVSQTVNWNLYGSHAIAFNPPDSALGGVLTRGTDGAVHINSSAVNHVGGSAFPGGPVSRPQTVFGGTYYGPGFHNSGLLTSYPPGLLSYSVQFAVAGTYSLRCLVHPAMVATIRVTP